MKNKTPQKGQLWAIGNRVFRILKVEGATVKVNHHDELETLYVRDLHVATPHQIAEYLGKE